jgi:DNA invertase Pin-like site-specific DNA recombinase
MTVLSSCINLLHNQNECQQDFAMKIGYARVSTQDQDNQAQITALHQAGCERVFQEKVSGGRWDRPELYRLMEQLRPGDVVVVYKLDRLSRSLKDLLLTLEKIELAGASFESVTEAIDTGTAAGRMMMQIVGSFAEFERAMLKERTRHGLEAARLEGRVGGRKPSLTSQQTKEAVAMVTSGQKSGAEVARLFKVHPATVSRTVSKARLAH